MASIAIVKPFEVNSISYLVFFRTSRLRRMESFQRPAEVVREIVTAPYAVSLKVWNDVDIPDACIQSSLRSLL